MCQILPECDSQAIECDRCGNDVMVGSCENGKCVECGFAPDVDDDGPADDNFPEFLPVGFDGTGRR